MASTPSTAVTPRRRVPRPVRWILAAFALAAVVVVAGLFSLRASDDRDPSTVPAATGVPRAPAATPSPPSRAPPRRSRSCRRASPPGRTTPRPARCSASRTCSAPARPATPPSTPAPTPSSAQALQLDPEEFNAILGQGSLALSRHDFRGALALGEQALALSQGGSQSAPRDHRRRAGRARPLPRGVRDVRPSGPPAPEPRRVRPPVLRLRAAGRPGARDRPHAPGRAGRLGQPREHAVDAHPARPPAERQGRIDEAEAEYRQALATSRTTRVRRPASARSPSRTATSQPPSSGTSRPPTTCRCPRS